MKDKSDLILILGVAALGYFVYTKQKAVTPGINPATGLPYAQYPYTPYPGTGASNTASIITAAGSAFSSIFKSIFG